MSGEARADAAYEQRILRILIGVSSGKHLKRARSEPLPAGYSEPGMIARAQRMKNLKNLRTELGGGIHDDESDSE